MKRTIKRIAQSCFALLFIAITVMPTQNIHAQDKDEKLKAIAAKKGGSVTGNKTGNAIQN